MGSQEISITGRLNFENAKENISYLRGLVEGVNLDHQQWGPHLQGIISTMNPCRSHRQN